MAFLATISSCTKEKDKDIVINLVMEKKWQTISQKAVPSWIHPVTGKIYADVFDFAKENFACVVDDYIVFHKNQTVTLFRGKVLCFPGQTDPLEGGLYSFDKSTDSLKLTVPFEVPAQPTVTTTFSCKVIELTNDKLVIKYNQILPFTETLHTITETYMRIP